jgi:hypothetical protein
MAKKVAAAEAPASAGVPAKAKAKAKPRRAKWTPAKEILFLEHLAFSSNIRASERVAKMPRGSAYRHRNASANFYRAWEQALADGYSMLELSMLERATKGVLVTKTAADGSKTTTRAFSDALATTLYRAHRETVARIRATAAAEGGKAELEAMLAEMTRRAREA